MEICYLAVHFLYFIAIAHTLSLTEKEVLCSVQAMQHNSPSDNFFSFFHVVAEPTPA